MMKITGGIYPRERTTERDPENMCPYGPQNHPLPEKKEKYLTTDELSEVTNETKGN